MNIWNLCAIVGIQKLIYVKTTARNMYTIQYKLLLLLVTLSFTFSD
jgi:hypothetical protein